MSSDTTENPLINRFLNDGSQKWRPLQASLEITNRCNERCSHCYLDNYTDDQARLLNLEDWKNILDKLKSAGSLYLILMGGEAMLSPLFWPIATYAAQKGFSVSTITNGLKIDSLEVAHRLKEIGFSYVTVSLYSLDPQIHDRMTRLPGSHERTVRAIEFLRSAGVPIGINCLLTKDNIESFFELADWCIERNLEIKADPAVTPKLNRDPSPTLLRASKEQLTKYYQTLIAKWPSGTPKPFKNAPEDHICNAGKGKCAVTAYGELLTCIEIREPLGLLHKSEFSELWQGPVAQKWRSLKMHQLKDAPKDSAYNFCDHCPGMALHETGDALKVSKFFTELADVKNSFSNEVMEEL